MLMGGQKMAARKFSFILLLFVVSCTTASGQEPVKLNNTLSHCVEISGMKITAEGKIPVLSFDLKVNKSIGECGCKSAVGSYTVYAIRKGHELGAPEEYKLLLIHGDVSLRSSEHKYLPLAAEQWLINKEKLEVEICCSNPH
jgi:hypothetical protein